MPPTVQWAGTTAANVRRLEVLTYDGVRMWVGPTDAAELTRLSTGDGPVARIYRDLVALRDRYLGEIRTRFPRIPRRISGYNLTELLPENGFNLARALVGSESTCVTILRAELDLLPEPRNAVTLLAGFDDIAAAADQVPLVNGHRPYILEGLDDKLIQYERKRRLNPVAIDQIPPAGAWLMIKMSGDSVEESAARARRLRDALSAAGGLRETRIYTDHGHQAELDSVREAALGATARVPGMPDTWPGWEDSAVPTDRLGDYLRDLIRLLGRYDLGAASLYGHFGQGCVHTSIPFDLTTRDGIARFRSFVTQAARLVVSYGGSLSGEHGDGQARGELLPIMYGDEVVRAFGEFKAIFDPAGRMNPGKVVDANPLDAQLRLGVGYRPDPGPTHFTYPQDGGFTGVPTRCFGVGACRRHNTEDGGVMCPSYQVTREEKHSTRGRMRLLFEMARGQTIVDGWRSPEVHEALDLCLSCKGCKSDCPVSVDMATYKSEFLSHHYAGRLRPRPHYSLGWLPVFARLAAVAPWAANAATHAPGLHRLSAAVAGVDPGRDLPRFAPRRFTTAFRRRPTGTRRGPDPREPVVLWPDTFTNAFEPRIPAAAVTVLEAAGYRVVIPPRTVCCGLTWISTGQLDMAARVLRRTLRVMAPLLDAGMPVIGLEPSCTSVLRDDVVNLLGRDNADAHRMARHTRTLAEFLDEEAPEFAPRLSTVDAAGSGDGAAREAIVQTHCHQHAVLGDAADRRVMERIGLRARVLDSGCCGLAGDFGLTADHRDVSLACAERVLLPAVREADESTIVMADGFSCRYQIGDTGTGRRPWHLAEVLAAAVAQDADGYGDR
jgi:Fe-S oxidoreductase/FAD/FMN-containing dehydrogenase